MNKLEISPNVVFYYFIIIIIYIPTHSLIMLTKKNIFVKIKCSSHTKWRLHSKDHIAFHFMHDGSLIHAHTRSSPL